MTEKPEDEDEEIEEELEETKAENEELPFPDGAEREITHASPDDSLSPGEEEPEAIEALEQKKDDGEHSDDRFIRRGQMQERLEKLQKAINLQDWEYALDINKHLGWDIEWMINN